MDIIRDILESTHEEDSFDMPLEKGVHEVDLNDVSSYEIQEVNLFPDTEDTELKYMNPVEETNAPLEVEEVYEEEEEDFGLDDLDSDKEIKIVYGLEEVILDISKTKVRTLSKIITKYKDTLSFIGKVDESRMNIVSNNELVRLASDAEPGRVYVITIDHEVKGADPEIRVLKNKPVELAKLPNWGSLMKYDDEEVFEVAKNFVKLPLELTKAILDLFMTVAILPKNPVEVTVNLVRMVRPNEDGTTEIRWGAIVPSQKVTAVSTEVSLERNRTLLTGSILRAFPAASWKHVGSIHSHHVMDPIFSPQDDAADLDGSGLHIVVGNLNKTPRATASLVFRGKRHFIRLRDIAEVPEYYMYKANDLSFSPLVLKDISI